MKLTDLREGDSVKIRNEYNGVAFRVIGPETVPDEDTEWSGYENPTGRVVLHMVGDDRHFSFDPEDLIALSDEEFCGGCGQIGCRC